MKDPTPIASFDRPEPAEIVAARLRDTCFQALVLDTSGESYWSTAGLKVRGQYKVMVPLVQAERAVSWLREFDAAEKLLAAALRCPQCGSTRVEYPQRALRQSRQLFEVTAPLDENDSQCSRCNGVWREEAVVPHVAAGVAA
jgi:hypothetical protein